MPIAGTRLLVPFRMTIPTPLGQAMLEATSFVTTAAPPRVAKTQTAPSLLPRGEGGRIDRCEPDAEGSPRETDPLPGACGATVFTRKSGLPDLRTLGCATGVTPVAEGEGALEGVAHAPRNDG